MIGQVLSGRYELEELVGTGGMSSVYRAHDRLLARKVALKVLHEHYGSDEAHVERFRREARAVATLSHPNIVSVIDRGEHEGRQFIVFEYVEGETLKRLIERTGPMPVPAALELAIQIARGLSFAHGQGLVHRDVKPQNVLLNGNGDAKVTDFGIARSLDVQHGMTQTGTVLGTSDYIAPEQAQGRRVDEHSDVYSLGVVLYELLTTKVPFPGENFVAVAMRHINEPPPSVRVERPDVPLHVEAALQTAMAKDPGDRFPTMAAFCQELEACLRELSFGDGDGTQIIPPLPRPRRHGGLSPWPVLALIVSLLAIGAIVAALVLTGHTPGNSGGGGGGSAGGSVHLLATTAYDPYGTDGEHDELAHYATDGNATTYWKTEHYDDAPSLAGKPGVGLVLDPGRAVALRELRIATSTPGFVAVIKGGDSPTSFTKDVSGSQTVSDGTTFSISGGSFRYYEVWITQLAPGFIDAKINEVTAT
jgi:tRNA A-37 threonylcarbamoyl transferase component Bud32